MKIIIEGLWGVGKTTLCKNLHDKYKFFYIQEPDHKKVDRHISDLDKWYLCEHSNNFNKFFKLINSAVMERSIVSTLAFMRTIGRGDKYVSNLVRGIDFKNYNKIDKCIILYSSSNKYKCYINNFLYDQDFIKTYSHFLQFYAEKIFGFGKVIKIDVSKNKNILNDFNLFKKITGLL